eukprot:Em0001g1626a
MSDWSIFVNGFDGLSSSLFRDLGQRLNTKVKDFKANVKEKTGVDVQYQRLLYSGKDLEDEKCLSLRRLSAFGARAVIAIVKELTRPTQGPAAGNALRRRAKRMTSAGIVSVNGLVTTSAPLLKSSKLFHQLLKCPSIRACPKCNSLIKHKDRRQPSQACSSCASYHWAYRDQRVTLVTIGSACVPNQDAGHGLVAVPGDRKVERKLLDVSGLPSLKYSGALAIWSVLDRLMKKCMPSPVQLMSCLVGWYLGSNLRFLRVNSLTLKKPKKPRHVTQHLHSQRQSCGLEVDGLLEALDTPDGKSQRWVRKRGSCTPWSSAGMRLLPHKPEWSWSSGSG